MPRLAASRRQVEVCAPLPAARPDPRHARPAPERMLLYALVRAHRAHLTRFHGIFAANAKSRAQLMPSGRGKRPATDAAAAEVRAIDEPRSHQHKRRAMSWAQGLKRVFDIDASACVHCGGADLPASNNALAYAPSSPTSRNTARGKRRTTGPQRARRLRRPRESSPATEPVQGSVEKPRAKTGRRHDAATTRRAALGPLPGIGEKCRGTAPLRRSAKPESHARTSDAGPSWRLCGRDLTPARQLPEASARKGRLNFLYPRALVRYRAGAGRAGGRSQRRDAAPAC